MTHKERMMAAVEGRKADRIPFAPRMDLWYIAQRMRGTLPAEFKNKNTVEIARELGVACHAMRADYTIPRPKEDLKLRGLGLDNHPDFPFRVELKKFPVHFEYDDENLRTRIETPKGDVVTHIRQSNEMLADGISLPMILSYPATKIEDFEALALVFDNIEIVPTPENYRAFKERIGDQGLAVANALHAASPLHFMFHDLMPMDTYFYMSMDNRKEMLDFAKRLEPFFERVLDAVLSCGCEAFLWGANYDQSTTYPKFFEEDIKPWLDHVGERARAAGKYSISHTDGESKALLGLFEKTNFQIAESVCAKPMTNCSLKEFREGVGKGKTVWGGIPAVALLEESMNEAEFDAYMDELFAELDGGERLILGVSDNVPPDASLERIRSIRERIEQYGPVGTKR